MTPQVFWLRDNQDENVVVRKVMPRLIDAASFACEPRVNHDENNGSVGGVDAVLILLCR